MKEHVAMYAGSFDPITSGHLDVVARSRHLFDRIIIGIGFNPEKESLFPVDERVSMATTLIEELVDLGLLQGTRKLADHLSLVKQLARRDSLNTKLLRDLLMFIDVDFDEPPVPVRPFLDLLQYRSQKTTRSAPLRPEIDQYGYVVTGLNHVYIERLEYLLHGYLPNCFSLTSPPHDWPFHTLRQIHLTSFSLR